jgi:hypothetical protein
MNFRDVDDTETGCGEIPALAAIQRLCNTGSARGRHPVPVRIHDDQRGQVKPFVLIYLNNHARMAKSADAADLKSAGRKAVGVQVPLWAPIKSIT